MFFVITKTSSAQHFSGSKNEKYIEGTVPFIFTMLSNANILPG